MRNNKSTSVAVGTLLAVVILAAGCGTAKTHGNQTANQTSNQTSKSVMASDLPQIKYTGPVVATYKGGQLTKGELDKQYNLQVVLEGQQSKESKKDFASWYAMWYKYLYSKAAAADKTPVDVAGAQKQADTVVSELANKSSGGPYKSVQDVQSKMKSLGLTKADMVDLVERTQVLQDYLNQQVYDKDKSLFIQVTVDQILVKTESQAKSIEAKLKAGANFAKLADQYSTDPGVKQNHGTYANSLAAEFVPPFAKACRTLPIGQISDPVKSQYGYHILRVDKRTQLTLAQAEALIQQHQLPQSVMMTLQQDEQTIAAQAQKDADVKIVAKTADL